MKKYLSKLFEDFLLLFWIGLIIFIVFATLGGFFWLALKIMFLIFK